MLSWQAKSANRHPAIGSQFMSMHQSLGFQLAQLGRDASAAVSIFFISFFYLGFFLQQKVIHLEF
jgi:hypothetical protein